MRYFSRTLCTYRVTESRRIKNFAIGLKIMKIQNPLSRNNATAIIWERLSREEKFSLFFWQNSHESWDELPGAADMRKTMDYYCKSRRRRYFRAKTSISETANDNLSCKNVLKFSYSFFLYVNDYSY